MISLDNVPVVQENNSNALMKSDSFKKLLLVTDMNHPKNEQHIPG